MPKSTLTKRTPVGPRPDGNKAPAFLDLGHRVIPEGTLVRASTISGGDLVGTLVSVDFKDGVPYTAAIRTIGNYAQMRHVYVGTVEPVV